MPSSPDKKWCRPASKYLRSGAEDALAEGCLQSAPRSGEPPQGYAHLTLGIQIFNRQPQSKGIEAAHFNNPSSPKDVYGCGSKEEGMRLLDLQQRGMEESTARVDVSDGETRIYTDISQDGEQHFHDDPQDYTLRPGPSHQSTKCGQWPAQLL